MKKLSRRGVVRLCSYALAVCCVLGGFWGVEFDRAEQYKAALERGSQLSFTQLTESITSIDTALQKSVYATTEPMVVALCTQIVREVNAAQNAMVNIDYSFAELENTAGFLSRVGDYAYFLAKSMGADGMSDDQRKNLEALSKTCSGLACELEDLQTRVYDEELTLYDLQWSGAQELSTAAYTIQQMEEEFPEVPSLIYDGPFSSHLDARVPKALEGLQTVGVEDAKRLASEFLDLEENLLTLESITEGKLKTYCFSAHVDGGQQLVEITEQGGRVLSSYSSRDAGEPKFTVEECLRTAKNFLGKRGFSGMRETYYLTEDGTVLFNFAYEEGDTLYYSDLIKVKVAQDSGRVVGFEAKGYLMNHYQRDIPVPLFTVEQAQFKVASNLTVEGTRLAVIPTSGGNEALCWEFKCQNGEGKPYLVYVNAETGNEEEILILLEDENGTLTI